MGKKRHESFNAGPSRDESNVFLDRLLQWLCDLQSNDIERFDEERVTELGAALAKKLDVIVFYDPDLNYRKGYGLIILLDEKGNTPLSKPNDNHFALLKASQFEVRVNISRKGGFFFLSAYTVLPVNDSSFLNPVQEQSKYLLKACDRITRFLTDRGLIQVPDTLLDRCIHGHNELGSEVTVKTQLFGEAI
ncbi:hypothetical protein H6F86_21840 [Phormidium sp. FACHB-592]|uniref:Uncharacterized protein n=1 Tax=Stenomitos frigidus AS-A4 TaxID=2933935 RepID=A0ABV0KFP2_9CYAN|nr:hypothetical protein [Phormidium sp. FACHB-592]MBD2076478.1 hypothetical protein [Phormidium sp. FACHB-592]